MDAMLSLTVAALTVIAAPCFWRRVSTPVRILTLGYFSFGILAVTVFHPTNAALMGPDYGPLTFYNTLSPWVVVGVLTFVAAGVFLGAVAVRLVTASFPGQDTTAARLRRVRIELPSRALWFSIFVLVLSIIGTGPSNVLHSSGYLQASGPAILVKVGSTLLPVGFMAASVVLFTKENSRIAKLSAMVVLVSTELYQLGQATRSFALFFSLLFIGGWLTASWSKRQSIMIGVSSVVVSVLTIGIPLQLRGEPQHGLIPALRYMLAEPSSFFSGLADPFYNILFGVPLSMFVWKQEPRIDTNALMTSVNPAPSGFTDWATVAPALRLNAYEPYSALGEALNHGWSVTLAFALLLGAVVEGLVLLARQCPGMWASGIQSLIIVVSALLLVRSTQYNLRTEVRLVYYLVLGVIALALVARHGGTQRRSRNTMSDEFSDALSDVVARAEG